MEKNQEWSLEVVSVFCIPAYYMLLRKQTWKFNAGTKMLCET